MEPVRHAFALFIGALCEVRRALFYGTFEHRLMIGKRGHMFLNGRNRGVVSIW
jgi:hypothetical protein